MKNFIKCEICDAEIPGDKCVFATHTRVIDGKEYVFCCVRCAETSLTTLATRVLNVN